MSITDGPAKGSVKGQAYNPIEVRDALKAAWEQVQDVDRDKAIKEVIHGDGRTVYTLDPELTGDLTDVQKVVLAHGGIPDWGGTVQGNTVTVHID